MTYTTFNKSTLKEFRKDLTCLLEVLEDHGDIKIKLGGISYTLAGDQLSIKLTATCAKGVDGITLSANELAYNQWAEYRKNTKKLGDTFIEGKDTYTICGWKPKSSKFPLLGKNQKGVVYKFKEYHAFTNSF